MALYSVGTKVSITAGSVEWTVNLFADEDAELADRSFSGRTLPEAAENAAHWLRAQHEEG